MNRINFIFLAFAITVTPTLDFAHGSTESALEQQKQHQSQASHDKKGKAQEIQGHIVELTCYLKHDAIGDKHRDCAKECAEKGLPLGLLTKDGTLYHIMGEGHEDLRSVNKKLLDYLEQDVRVVGEVFEKNHTHVVVIQKIKKL